MSHEFTCKVYYEDTDLAGVVYYANYLKFIERARTEALREAGVDQRALLQEAGVVFVVRRVEIDYIAPARFQDELVVRTSTERVSGARALLLQEVCRGADILARAHVQVAAMGRDGRPARMPAPARAALEAFATG